MLLNFVSIGAVLAAGPAIAAPPTTAPAPAAHTTVEETSLGTVAGYDAPRNIAMDTDANHVAFVGVRDKEQFVVLDGKSGPPFDQVMAESLEFSPKGSHLGYLVQTATETLPVIDGKPGKGYYSIAHNRIFWSADGKRTAYAAQFQNGGGAMIVDGVEGTHYDAADIPLFSFDSLHLAYIARRGKSQCIVLDGKEQKFYDAVGHVTFSPNSKHLTYEAIVNGKAMLVMDGQEGKAYDLIEIGPGFSSDGARLVAVVAQAGKLLIVVNGRESAPFDALLRGDFILSPDGKHIAYAVKQANQQFVINDGVSLPAFDHIGAYSLVFSPDSKRLAYEAGDAGPGHEYVVVDGVKGKNCDGVLSGTPFFSPDSKRVAYGARRKTANNKNATQFVIDGVEGKLYEDQPPLREGEKARPGVELPAYQMFSPDSRHFAYRAFSAERPIAVIDSVESPPAEAIGPIVFSPDNKHWAYLHVRDDKTYLVLDGTEVAGPYNPLSPRMVVLFDDATTLHVIATRKDEFLRVKVKINP
jgi:hypothetical protein